MLQIDVDNKNRKTQFNLKQSGANNEFVKNRKTINKQYLHVTKLISKNRRTN